MTSQNWADTLGARVAAAVRAVRVEQGHSAQWIADRTAEAGFPISRGQIANYESGRKRSFDIAELVVLAWVLRVPPVRLLYPDLPDGPVEIVPGVEKTSIEAVLWFSGEMPYLHPGDTPADAIAAKASIEPVELAREKITLETSIPVWLKLAGAMKDSAMVQSFVDQIAAANARIDVINDRLREINDGR